MQKEKPEFRCPFEVQGRQEGTILEVPLLEDKIERLEALHTALNKFYVAKEIVAIRLRLPRLVLRSCVNNEDVRKRVMPFQAELIAAEADWRLRPFLPYQILEYGKGSADKLISLAPWRAVAGGMLLQMMTKDGVRAPKNVVEMSIWIEANFEFALQHGMKVPHLYLWQPTPEGGRIDIVTITPSSLVLHADRVHMEDPHLNRNCFSIVKTPFYPKGFGRYSEDIEIVLSREADFAKLSPKVRKQIRTRSNEVLQAHGVKVTDLEGDKQETGVWIPEYITS